ESTVIPDVIAIAGKLPWVLKSRSDGTTTGGRVPIGWVSDGLASRVSLNWIVELRMHWHTIKSRGWPRLLMGSFSLSASVNERYRPSCGDSPALSRSGR